MLFNSISFSNFRNYQELFNIPIEPGVTLIVGPNNVGKSNIFRLLALFFGNKYSEIDNVLDFAESHVSGIIVELNYPKSFLAERLRNRANARDYIEKSELDNFVVRWNLKQTGSTCGIANDELLKFIPRSYFATQHQFISDFKNYSSEIDENFKILSSQVTRELPFPNTVLVPSDRYVISNGQSINRFDPRSIPATS